MLGPTRPTGPTGADEETGPTGPTGADGSGFVIPFASGITDPPASTDISGESTAISLLGFGYATAALIPLVGGTTFDVLTVPDYAFPFVMPTDATLTAIYGTYSPVVAFTPATNITLYTAIATAAVNTTVFTIVPESITPASQAYMNTVPYPANSPTSGSSTGLSIILTAGTRVAIVCGFTTEAGVGTPAQTLPFSYTGSLLFS